MQTIVHISIYIYIYIVHIYIDILYIYIYMYIYIYIRVPRPTSENKPPRASGDPCAHGLWQWISQLSPGASSAGQDTFCAVRISETLCEPGAKPGLPPGGGKKGEKKTEVMISTPIDCLLKRAWGKTCNKNWSFYESFNRVSLDFGHVTSFLEGQGDSSTHAHALAHSVWENRKTWAIQHPGHSCLFVQPFLVFQQLASQSCRFP